jgi:hypothetical protein
VIICRCIAVPKKHSTFDPAKKLKLLPDNMLKINALILKVPNWDKLGGKISEGT